MTLHPCLPLLGGARKREVLALLVERGPQTYAEIGRALDGDPHSARLTVDRMLATGLCRVVGRRGAHQAFVVGLDPATLRAAADSLLGLAEAAEGRQIAQDGPRGPLGADVNHDEASRRRGQQEAPGEGVGLAVAAPPG